MLYIINNEKKKMIRYDLHNNNNNNNNNKNNNNKYSIYEVGKKNKVYTNLFELHVPNMYTFCLSSCSTDLAREK